MPQRTRTYLLPSLVVFCILCVAGVLVYSLAFPQDEPLRGDALTRVFVTYRVFTDTPKMQIYDKNLVPLFDDKYSDVELAPEGDIKYFLVCKNDSYGILDRSGSKVVGFKHEQGKVFGDKIVIGQPNEWFVFDAISGDINGPFDYYVIVPTFGVYKDDPRKYCFLREPHDKDKTDEKGFLDSEFRELTVFSTARSTLFPGGLYATYVIAEGAHHRTWTFYDINKRKGLSVIGVLKVVPSANAEFPETFPHKKDKYARRHFIDLAKRPKFLAWVKDTDEGGYVFIDSSADAALRVEADKVKYLGLDYFYVRTGTKAVITNFSGNEISVEPACEDSYFSNGLMPVKLENAGSWVVVDDALKTVGDREFDHATPFCSSNGEYSLVSDGEEFYLIDTELKRVPGTGWSQAELVKRNPDYVYFETAESKGIYRASRMAQASVARDSDFSIDTKMSAVSSFFLANCPDGCLVKAYGSQEGVFIEGASSDIGWYFTYSKLPSKPFLVVKNDSLSEMYRLGPDEFSANRERGEQGFLRPPEPVWSASAAKEKSIRMYLAEGK